jgi:hypothetical protein
MTLVLVKLGYRRDDAKPRAIIQGDDHAIEYVPGMEEVYKHVTKGCGFKVTYAITPVHLATFCSLFRYQTLPYDSSIRYRLDMETITVPVTLTNIWAPHPIVVQKSLTYSVDCPVPLEKYVPQYLKSMSFNSEVPLFREKWLALKEKYGVADEIEGWFLRRNRSLLFKIQQTAVHWHLDPTWNWQNTFHDSPKWQWYFENYKEDCIIVDPFQPNLPDSIPAMQKKITQAKQKYRHAKPTKEQQYLDHLERSMVFNYIDSYLGFPA